MKLKFLAAVLFFLALFLLSACQKNNISQKETYKGIETIQVHNEDKKLFHGFVKSQLISPLSFQTEGRIIFMPYTKGDYVKKGQVLARLDGVLYKIKKNEEQARLQNTIIQYNKAKSTFRRMDILHKEGGISDNDWEEAYFDLKSYDEQVRIQREKIRYLDKEIAYNIITAPYDGFITQKLSETGSYAKVGDPVLIMSGSSKTQIETMVDSSIVNKINLDETVEVEALNNKYKGQIAHISKNSISEGGYLVKIYLEDFFEELKDGMSADVTIPFSDMPIVFIPLNSVFSEDEDKYVYKVTSIKNNTGIIKKEKIKTGQIQDEKIEVLQGLKDGDYIISKGLSEDIENTKIKL